MFDLLLWIIYFFAVFPFADISLALFWIISVHFAWKIAEEKNMNTREYAKLHAFKIRISSLGERQLSATIVTTILSGIVTGTSIIIVGIGAFATLSAQPNTNLIISINVFYAAIFAVVALGLALYCLQILPSRTPGRNLVSDKLVALFSASALFFTLAAGVRFLVAVGSILFLR